MGCGLNQEDLHASYNKEEITIQKEQKSDQTLIQVVQKKQPASNLPDKQHIQEEDFQIIQQDQRIAKPSTPTEASFNSRNIRKSTYRSSRYASNRGTETDQNNTTGTQQNAAMLLQTMNLDIVDE